jgi:hypothetical protein
MPNEEEEMSLTRWRGLLERELKIALEELGKTGESAKTKRYQRYVESCAEQCWRVFARSSGQAQKPAFSGAAEKAGLHSWHN